MNNMDNIVLNDLYDYKGLKIYQNEKKFKFSLDSILLAEYINLKNKKSNILDMCTGNAVIPLILATKTKSIIDAFEIQKNIAYLAEKSVSYNKLNNQITIYNDDIKNIAKYVKNKKYDIITCNPPYFKIKNSKFINEYEDLAIARHELKINLEDIFKIASSSLNDKGEFYLIQRATRLDEVIILANKYNLNVKNIELIQTKSNNKPYIIIVRCLKNSKYGVIINKIINIENRKTYQNMFVEDI